jgi:hypothetical protein
MSNYQDELNATIREKDADIRARFANED